MSETFVTEKFCEERYKRIEEKFEGVDKLEKKVQSIDTRLWLILAAVIANLVVKAFAG
jgi:hypothetical protein